MLDQHVQAISVGHDVNSRLHTHIRTMTGYSTTSELANENGSIVWCLAILGGLFGDNSRKNTVV